MTLGTQRPDTKVEVILGVDTHTWTSTRRWPWTIWAEKPGRVECTNERKWLREASVLGGRLWPREVCRDRRHQQLRSLKLARHLKAAGISVMEVERPKRRHLRRTGKSDPIDAEAAARTVLAGEAVGEPKSGDGKVEMIRVLRSARQSAVKSRSQAANQLQALLVTAPEDLRHRLRQLPTKELVAICARFRLGSDPDEVRTATKFALRSVARRYEALSEEIAELDAQLDQLVAQVAPELVSLPGIGTDHAATLLIVAGENPQRLSSEASFASLCGVSPVEASSGKVVRHRLNRGGNREANRALYMICLARMRRDRRTKEYVARRTAEGKSKREIIRCLKRYIAREVYRVLISRGARSSPTVPMDEAHIVTGSSAA